MHLKAFFHYFGGKHRLAPQYPAPTHRTVIEPFAGSAGYACRYPDRQVRLYDASPVIAGIWHYLIRTSAEEIRQLPTRIDHIDDLTVCQEAKWLIGFWLQGGTASPRKQPSAWMRMRGEDPTCYWGATTRDRIAGQVDAIRHWTMTQASVFDIPNTSATWFVDPPYQNPCGRAYPHKFTAFEQLGDWCQSRRGQVIVCEQEGATWLPFRPFRETHTSVRTRHAAGRVSREVIFTV